MKSFIQWLNEIKSAVVAGECDYCGKKHDTGGRFCSNCKTKYRRAGDKLGINLRGKWTDMEKGPPSNKISDEDQDEI